jgi:hypothetical protein
MGSNLPAYVQADLDVGFYICCSRADYYRAFAVSQIYGLQVSIRISAHTVYENTRPNTNVLILIVIAADGLYKRDVFRMCRSRSYLRTTKLTGVMFRIP